MRKSGTVDWRGLGLGIASAVIAGEWIERRLRSRRNLSGQVAVVTGGSRGLGLVLARELARRGARVIICARAPAELELGAQRIVRELGIPEDSVLVRACDVSRQDEVRETVRYTLAVFGRLDIFVNDAGIIQVGPLDAQSTRDFDESMAVNFWGVYNGSMEAYEVMKRQGSGRILNITSIGGAVPVPHLLPYSAAKFAAAGFSQGLYSEARRHGVHVTTVIPGLLRTGSFVHALLKGNRERELAWFSWGAAFPFVSMNADRAGRIMIDACIREQPVVVVGLPAKALRLGFQLLPNVALRVFAGVNRLLPDAPEGSAAERAEPGYLHRTAASSPPVTILGDIAAADLNENGPGVEDRPNVERTEADRAAG